MKIKNIQINYKHTDQMQLDITPKRGVLYLELLFNGTWYSGDQTKTVEQFTTELRETLLGKTPHLPIDQVIIRFADDDETSEVYGPNEPGYLEVELIKGGAFACAGSLRINSFINLLTTDLNETLAA